MSGLLIIAAGVYGALILPRGETASPADGADEEAASVAIVAEEETALPMPVVRIEADAGSNA